MHKLLFPLTIFSLFALTSIASASTTSDLQPAQTITYNENLTVNGTGRFDSAYIGKTTGEGGVTFFNGTMINASAGNIPLTMGDDLRVDGMIWRGTSKGTSDDMGLKFADSLWPAATNLNDIGTEDLQFKDGYFAGNLQVGDIQGNDIINTNEIATSNNPSSNQLLSYNGEELEWVTVGTSDTDDDTDDDTDNITVGDITSVTAGTGLDGGGTSGGVTLRVANDGITGAMIDDGTITGSDLTSTYSSGAAYDDRFVNVSGDTMAGKLTVNGSNDSSNLGIVGITNSNPTGIGIYANASDSSGNNFGGIFTTASNKGLGIGATATATSGVNYAGFFTTYSSDGYSGYFGGGNFTVSLGSGSEFYISNGNLGIGVSPAERKLHVSASNSPVARFNRSNDGSIIEFQSAGVTEGTISIAGATTSYNAFTGSHYAYIDNNNATKEGYLMAMTGNNRNLHNDPDSEIIYGVSVSQEKNASNILGAYLGKEDFDNENSPHLVMAVGNGRVWVAENGSNINIGDYLISSDLAGHAEKDLGIYENANIIARAAESVNWNDITQTEGRVRHRKISVFFENFVLKHNESRIIEQEEKINKLKLFICNKYLEEEICE